MYFLFSGEGATDLGEGKPGPEIAEGADFSHGPMAVFVDQVVQARHLPSPLHAGPCGFISEATINRRAGELKAARKSVRLSGAKTPKETRYYFNNARILARVAREKQDEIGTNLIAVLFRDADGTASSGRGEWADKWKSMLDGFAEEGFDRGVPMIPKPKSEAWLLCAFKENPYEHCEALEDRPGNDRSPNSLKRDLQGYFGAMKNPPSTIRERLLRLIQERNVDANQIEMPSFVGFRERLESVVSKFEDPKR